MTFSLDTSFYSTITGNVQGFFEGLNYIDTYRSDSRLIAYFGIINDDWSNIESITVTSSTAFYSSSPGGYYDKNDTWRTYQNFTKTLSNDNKTITIEIPAEIRSDMKTLGVSCTTYNYARFSDFSYTESSTPSTPIPKIGSDDVSKIYLGSEEISKIYLGNEVVYEAQTPPANAISIVDNKLYYSPIGHTGSSDIFLPVSTGTRNLYIPTTVEGNQILDKSNVLYCEHNFGDTSFQIYFPNEYSSSQKFSCVIVGNLNNGIFTPYVYAGDVCRYISNVSTSSYVYEGVKTTKYTGRDNTGTITTIRSSYPDRLSIYPSNGSTGISFIKQISSDSTANKYFEYTFINDLMTNLNLNCVLFGLDSSTSGYAVSDFYIEQSGNVIWTPGS